jgi:hypothetical protein
MSPTRSGYKELGLEIVSLDEKRYPMPKRPLMVRENKYDGTRDPFKILCEETLMQPSATLATTKLDPCEPDETEEGESLFHSHMWVKGTPLHFIIDRGRKKNLTSAEVVKRLSLPITSHPQPYTIGWLCQGSDIHISQKCLLSYDIKPFKDEVLCDISPLEVCNVLLGQPYL